ncbi:hypothetical protein HGP17_14715 [Rhizobium sp. P38BS-XIX]|uniref:hypothetical protein n=1 Tax=Rhizobium sp. P38BS-XIX TaxID=2726740 RepID=UPI001456C614|nr:hypothetical protein [Rhizobium sp. P38BS-XIX]NLR98066.1 hypothetical protein [Rhizobium sp. P38BS-XIX]
MTNDTEINQPADNAPKRRAGRRHVAAFSVAAIAILAIGATGGAVAISLTRPSVQMPPIAPVAISSLKDDWNIVTVKGKVAELFGNKFIVQDDTGRALVETGPAGESGKLVEIGEPVRIQGRFDEGFLHASFLIRQDGETVSLGPPAPPPPHGGPIEAAMRHLRL